MGNGTKQKHLVKNFWELIENVLFRSRILILKRLHSIFFGTKAAKRKLPILKDRWFDIASDQKPNSWTYEYNFVEFSWHNLESSQTWGFRMDFLNRREEGTVFYKVFFFSPLQFTIRKSRNCKRLREFEEREILRQS